MFVKLLIYILARDIYLLKFFQHLKLISYFFTPYLFLSIKLLSGFRGRWRQHRWEQSPLPLKASEIPS